MDNLLPLVDVHFVRLRVADHPKHGIQIGWRQIVGAAECKLVNELRQEQKQLCLCQGLAQTHSGSCSERQETSVLWIEKLAIGIDKTRRVKQGWVFPGLRVVLHGPYVEYDVCVLGDIVSLQCCSHCGFMGS